MGLSDNPYIDLPLATVQSLQAQWLQVSADIATGGKSYSFPGRSFTRADLAEVRAELVLLRNALRYITGTGKQSAHARINTQDTFAG